MRDARIAVRDASNYLARKALFLEKEVHSQLDAFVGSAWKAIIAREIIMEIGPHDAEGIQRDDEDFRKNADAQMKELEQLVRGRFWGLAKD